MARSRRRKSKPQSDRAILNFLSVWDDPKESRAVVSKASDNVIKGIVNSVLNVERSEHLKGKLDPALRRKLSRHRVQIAKITSGRGTIKTKRRLILQRGGSFLSLLPILLSTVLSTIGSAVLPKILGRDQQ